MTAPIDEGLLRLESGKETAWAVYGAPDGMPVLFFHGFPGSRQQAAIVADQAARQSVRLIAFDRPGFGATPWQVASRVQDCLEAVDGLQKKFALTRCGALGVSCGGPYALESAATWPDCVGVVALLAGIAPMHEPGLTRGQHPMLRAMFALGRMNPGWAKPMFLADRYVFTGREDKAIKVLAKMLSPADAVLLDESPRVASLFVRAMAEAYRQGVRGSIGELGRIARYKGEGLPAIRVRVHLFQGDQDSHVTEGMARFLAAQIPQSQLHMCPGEGHLSIVIRQFAAAVDVIRRELRRDES